MYQNAQAIKSMIKNEAVISKKLVDIKVIKSYPKTDSNTGILSGMEEPSNYTCTQ